MSQIDLNADLGEGCGSDAALLGIVSSANIACGGHAGDDETMAETLRLAIANGVAAGAHPGYPDRAGFGRVSGYLDGDELHASLTSQVHALANMASSLGVQLAHVKPHGALYNDAVKDDALADIVASVTANAPGSPALMGMANSAMQLAAERHKINFIPEGFVDRAYEPDGTLVARSKEGAVHSDLEVATAQALRLAQTGEVMARDGSIVSVVAETLCIHGDTPGAAAAAASVRDVLQSHGVEISARPTR